MTNVPSSPWQRRLAGIVITPRLREALFEQNGDTRVMREGERIDGWTLTDVHPGGVTLRSGGEEETRNLQGVAPGEAQPPQGAQLNKALPAEQEVAAASAKQEAEQAIAEVWLKRATRRMAQH
jgi:hypothetical protein